VLSDGAERVLSEMLFHADVTDAAKARPPIMALMDRGMTRSVVDDDRNDDDLCLVTPGRATK